MLSGFGFGMKSARVADQIDAEVRSAKNIVQNTKMTLGQFDFVESTLAQLTQMAQGSDPALAMQFHNLQSQIDNIQKQVVQSFSQIEQALTNIDSLTDRIQN
jgi:Na+/phosphate symporter